MKRSEAIKRFIEIVRDNCYDEGFVLCEEEADKMLKELENMGMLPPTYCGYSSIPINRWESEDESR